MKKTYVDVYRDYLEKSEYFRNSAGTIVSMIVEDCLEKSGKSLRGLAKDFKISPAFLSDMKNGKRTPSEKTLLKMEKVIKSSIQRGQ